LPNRSRGAVTPPKFAACFGFSRFEVEENNEIKGLSDARE